MNPYIESNRLRSLLLITALMLTGCSVQQGETETKKPRKFSVPVELGKVVYLDVEDRVRTIGVILEEKRVVISSQVDGKIIDIPAREGAKVKANDVLARVDPRDYQLEADRLHHDLAAASEELEKAQTGLRPEEKERLKARVESDRSSLDLALKKLDRIKVLVAEGVVAQADLDAATDEVRRSRENLRAGEAGLKAGMHAREGDIAKQKALLEGIQKQYDRARLDLSKTTLRAPFDGMILKKRADLGVFVEPETPVIEMIMSPGVIAGMTLPQRYRSKLDQLESVELYIKELDRTIRLDKKHAQRVQVIPDADIYSGNFNFWIDLVGKGADLFPGLTFEARLYLGTRQKVLHVPSSALVISEQGTVVYIVKEGRAQRIPVRAFKEQDGLVEIQDFTNRLSPDADLILRGSGAVFQGAAVKVTAAHS